jgi:hypothetical protein
MLVTAISNGLWSLLMGRVRGRIGLFLENTMDNLIDEGDEGYETIWERFRIEFLPYLLERGYEAEARMLAVGSRNRGWTEAQLEQVIGLARRHGNEEVARILERQLAEIQAAGRVGTRSKGKGRWRGG